jgi:hypothetical protein
VVNVLVVSDTPATPPEQPDYLGRDGSPESNRDPGRATGEKHSPLGSRGTGRFRRCPRWRVAAEQMIGQGGPGWPPSSTLTAGRFPWILCERRLTEALSAQLSARSSVRAHR